ncbi:ATP-binding protein [Roseomonas sp. USHLN139]|uniref:ATP-binding protein n=1 Tax=Roseomonas sp. USHLN139 TaxID=3081298 RepID=UPI003B0298B4
MHLPGIFFSIASSAFIAVAATSVLSDQVWQLTLASLAIACVAGAISASLSIRAQRRLTALAALLEATADGDFEIRMTGVPGPGVVGAIEVAANRLLDVTDAFLREAGGAMGAAAEGRHYRKVLLRGLPGVFQETAHIINTAGAELESKTLRLAETSRTTFARRIAALPAMVYEGQLNAAGTFEPLYVSDNAERILGWTASQLTQDGGRHWHTLPARQSPELNEAFYASVLREGFGTREYQMRRADGELCWVRDHARVADRSECGAAAIIGYLADVSAEKAIQAKAQFGSRLATLGEMATGLAHELNQPLAVMSMAAENATRALRASRPDDALVRLDRIGSQAQRAREIVDHLRIFGRSDDGKPPQPISLVQAVEGALILAGGALRDAAITVQREIEEALPHVLGQLVPLEQTIVNLLLNARDAISSSSVQGGRIAIRAMSSDSRVELQIEDNGGGIPDSALDRIFEPFFTTKEIGKGTGLGLPICHSTMRRFGGEIHVANTESGAVFRLVFLESSADVKP